MILNEFAWNECWEAKILEGNLEDDVRETERTKLIGTCDDSIGTYLQVSRDSTGTEEG